MSRYTRMAVAVGLAAATLLPLARYKSYATGQTTMFHAGDFAVAIGSCALAAAALSLLPQIRYRLCAVLVASVAVVLAVAAAWTRIAMANDASNLGRTPGDTAYTFGAGLVTLLALALLFLVVTVHNEARHARDDHSTAAHLPQSTFP
jgi:hypothetical protein